MWGCLSVTSLAVASPTIPPPTTTRSYAFWLWVAALHNLLRQEIRLEPSKNSYQTPAKPTSREEERENALRIHKRSLLITPASHAHINGNDCFQKSLREGSLPSHSNTAKWKTASVHDVSSERNAEKISGCEDQMLSYQRMLWILEEILHPVWQR